MITRYVFETEEDWKEKRNWVFTASEINRLMASVSRVMTENELIIHKKNNPKSRTTTIVDPTLLAEGALTYIIEKISAYYDEPKFVYKSFEMEHGTITEPEAALTLCEILNLNPASDEVIYTSHNGTVFYSDEVIGGTPDLIFPYIKAIAEIKCPNSQTHLANKLFLTAENFEQKYPIYYDQIQTNLYLTESNLCYFFSFDPRFKKEYLRTHLIEIKRNEERINAIIAKSKIAFDYKNQLIEQLENTNKNK